jgi:polysaccharide biosynthesis/export protein
MARRKVSVNRPIQPALVRLLSSMAERGNHLAWRPCNKYLFRREFSELGVARVITFDAVILRPIMLNSPLSSPRRSPGGSVWPYLPLMLCATAIASGCQNGRYRAEKLPLHLQAPTTSNQQINLQNVPILRTGSSLIGPGDLIQITLASGGEDKKVEPVLARVDESGNVNLPLIGVVHISGVEPFEAAEIIAAASVERNIYRQPAVVVKMEQFAFNQVTVLGAVTEPGLQKLPLGSSDVLNAIASAGGFAKEAGTQIEITRKAAPSAVAPVAEPGNVVQASFNQPFFAPPPLNPEASTNGRAGAASSNNRTYRLNLAKADPTRAADYRLGDGDVVMVLPEKERAIHVSGLVNRADQFEIPKNQDLYVLDAIAMAGGVKSPVADKVIIIRRFENMTAPVVIEVSIAKAKKDGAENLRLAAGDMVSVEATVLTNTVDTITTFFRMSLGIGGNFATF